jgi:acyl-coenzyme A synthetase/AMP-(fatty) acid ligase/acyl carrier protein
MIHHGGMLNHLYAKIKDLSITEKDTVAQTAPPSFDISIWQFLACLLTGGRTYIIDREKVFEPRLLLKELHKGEVTIFESVPSLLTTILDELPKDHKNLLGQLRWMVPTGEQLGTALVRKWYASFPYIKLMNAYGPTEASDDVTHYVVEYPVEGQSIIPIGKPIRNIHVYVLDEYLNLCPVGVKGQLCVSGIGVGKGYWRDEEKTKQAFVSNPLKNKPDPINYNTIYKTGDTGYYLENGNIVCLGRIDNQVKVRGFRIELGEIESVLSQYGPVQEAVVIAKEQGEDKYLVAYYVAQSELDPDELKNYLATKLVDYMIPSYYVQLKKIPLTPNGKLDKKALPDPRMILGNDYAPPTNDVEKKLAEIWSEVLQIPKEIISVKAGFFELGGHSLKATVLVNKIQKYFDVEVPLKEIFNKQSIESLADYLITVRQTDSEIESESTMIEIAV